MDTTARTMPGATTERADGGAPPGRRRASISPTSTEDQGRRANDPRAWRLTLVRGALEAWATGELDAGLSERARDELGRSLVSIERWLSGGERYMPRLDARRAFRCLSRARELGPLPRRARGAYLYLSALAFTGNRV